MDEVAVIESTISRLDQEIERAKEVVNRIKRERAPFERATAAARRRVAILRLKHWLRRPAKSYELWRIGLIFVGAALIGSILFVFAHFVTTSMPVALTCMAVSTIFAASGLSIAAFHPSDKRLQVHMIDAEAELQAVETKLANQRANDGLQTAELRLTRLFNDKREQLLKLRAEISYEMRNRRMLLQQDWRGMRDNEWEEYLVRVFRALGAKAQRIGGAGDQVVDLIVEVAKKRIAVQAKGYLHPVANKAIQEAFAGMAHHGCDFCAVITNSQFTKGAHEIAVSTCCILIGEEEFPDFVIGNLKLEYLFATTKG
jgi:HJR/Mrr/RecB family endonuclease